MKNLNNRPTQTPKDMQRIVRAFIGNLIDETDRILEQVYPIHQEHIGADMDDESFVLETIYLCHDYNIAPNASNVAQQLCAKGWLDQNAAESIVKELVEYAKDNHEGIRALSAHIWTWTMEARALATTESISEQFRDPYMDYPEKHRRAMSLLLKISPSYVDSATISNAEILEEVMRKQNEIADMREKGMDIGPTLPFAAAQVFYPRLQWREITTILGSTGGGKTTMGMVHAEHIAWTQNIQCDALFISLETDVERLISRQQSRHMMLPHQMFIAGKVSQKNPKYKKLFDEFNDKINDYSHSFESTGEVRFKYLPVPTIDGVIAAMEENAAISKALGRRLVIFIDYLQKIGSWCYPGSGMSDAQVYQQFGEQVASTNRYLNTHTVFFGQYNEATGEAFGSSVIRKISQLAFVIKRDEPDGGVRENAWVTNSENKNITDALGSPRAFHRVGDKFSAYADLECIKANDVAPETIKIIFESDYNRVYQNPKQLKELRRRGLIE